MTTEPFTGWGYVLGIASFLLVAGIVLLGREWIDRARARNGAPVGRWEPAEPRAFATRTWRWATCEHGDGFQESSDDFIRGVARCRWCGWTLATVGDRRARSRQVKRPGEDGFAVFVLRHPSIMHGSTYELWETSLPLTRRLPVLHPDVYGDVELGDVPLELGPYRPRHARLGARLRSRLL